MVTSQFDLEDDPNAPSATEIALKRVEAAIRKRGDCALLLLLDGICLETNAKKRMSDLAALTRRLEEK